MYHFIFTSFFSILDFDLHFCNVKPNGLVQKQITVFFANMFDNPFKYVQFHHESHFELFPEDRFTYLTQLIHGKTVILMSLIFLFKKFIFTEFRESNRVRQNNCVECIYATRRRENI